MAPPVCDGCKNNPGHGDQDCDDAQHPHRAYRSCPCQHQPYQPRETAPSRAPGTALSDLPTGSNSGGD